MGCELATTILGFESKICCVCIFRVSSCCQRFVNQVARIGEWLYVMIGTKEERDRLQHSARDIWRFSLVSHCWEKVASEGAAPEPELFVAYSNSLWMVGTGFSQFSLHAGSGGTKGLLHTQNKNSNDNSIM